MKAGRRKRGGKDKGDFVSREQTFRPAFARRIRIGKEGDEDQEEREGREGREGGDETTVNFDGEIGDVRKSKLSNRLRVQCIRKRNCLFGVFAVWENCQIRC